MAGMKCWRRVGTQLSRSCAAGADQIREKHVMIKHLSSQVFVLLCGTNGVRGTVRTGALIDEWSDSLLLSGIPKTSVEIQECPYLASSIRFT